MRQRQIAGRIGRQKPVLTDQAKRALGRPPLQVLLANLRLASRLVLREGGEPLQEVPLRDVDQTQELAVGNKVSRLNQANSNVLKRKDYSSSQRNEAIETETKREREGEILG